MLLAVDIGNSNIKFGIFDGEQLLTKKSLPTQTELTSDTLTSLIDDDIVVSTAVVCSVVPDKDDSVKRSLKSAFEIDAFFVGNELDLGLKINYEPLSSLGTDRLINSFAAVEKYGAPCVVCSIGTATTIDVISKDRELRGGVIAPGMEMMARALHVNTAKLPEVSIEEPARLLGNSTAESIQSGIFNGQLAMVNGLIHSINKDVEPGSKVVATGGCASLIAEHTSIIDIVDENLLLDGLRLLYERLQSE